MPFTPFHFGPGVAVKAAAPRQFSFIAFAMTQVALDVEVLWNMARGAPSLHSVWHSFLGATVVAIVITVLGKPVSQWIKSIWNRLAAASTGAHLTVAPRTTWLASFLGAFVGACTHVILDSIYHADPQPFWPWSIANPFQGFISPQSLELLCVALGIVGLAGYLVRACRIGRDIGRPTPRTPLPIQDRTDRSPFE